MRELIDSEATNVAGGWVNIPLPEPPLPWPEPGPTCPDPFPPTPGSGDLPPGLPYF
jgi:hypothetical protein